MSTTFTNLPSCLCIALKTLFLFVLLIGLGSHPLLGNQKDLLCNDHTCCVNAPSLYQERLVAPIANDDNTETDEDDSVDIDVLDNDVYGDEPLDLPVVTDGPKFGTATINPDSTITYTPDSNFVGIDTFTYQICDTLNQCDDALVIIIVNLVIDTIEDTILEDSSFTVCATELTTFNEPADTINVCDGPSNGSLIPSAGGECIIYSPILNFTGADTFCLVVCHPDSSFVCDTTIIIITITPLNDPPDAVDDEDTTGINITVTIDVLLNDSDPDTSLGAPMIGDTALHGVVVVNPDSTVTYTPDEDFVGVDSFTYFICDAGVPVYCDTATVTVYVLPVRDTIGAEILVDSTLEICVSLMTELGNPMIMTVCDSPSNSVVLLVDTCLTLIPDQGFIGSDTTCIVICDSLGPCDTTIIIITVALPLPVRLMSFDARKSGSTSVLTWETAFEYNSDYFEVQRAGGDKVFSKIATIESVGNSQSHQSYDYIDESPHAEVSYYRLHMMDRDGGSSFSPIKSVAFDGEDLKVRLWPNPAQSELNIEVQGGIAEPGKLSIINSEGRIIMEQSFHVNLQKSTVDLSRVGPGLYTVIIQSAHHYSTQKFVVFR